MALKKKYIPGVAGLTYIEDAEFFGAEMMLVMRAGKPLVETTDTPTGRRFRHTGTRIELPAAMPIEGHVEDTGAGELIVTEDFYAEYKT